MRERLGTTDLREGIPFFWDCIKHSNCFLRVTGAGQSFHRQPSSSCLPPFSSSNKKWQEKAGLLTRLEGQVMRMKDNFDAKERLLLEERDKAEEAHKYAPLWTKQSTLYKTYHFMFTIYKTYHFMFTIYKTYHFMFTIYGHIALWPLYTVYIALCSLCF